MLKKIIIFPVFIIISCITSYPGVEIDTTDKISKGQQDNPFSSTDNEFWDRIWNMSGESGYLYFSGFSPVYAEKINSDKILLKEASEAAAVFDGVFGVSEKYTERSSFGTKHGSSFNYIYSRASLEKYLENLEPYYSYEDANTSYRVFRIADSCILPEIEKSRPEITPEWIKRLPEVKGYVFSVGVSGRYSSIADSAAKADDNALEEMIKQKNISIISVDSIFEQGMQYSRSELHNFYIIRRWWSPDMKYFYSLGTLPE